MVFMREDCVEDIPSFLGFCGIRFNIFPTILMGRVNEILVVLRQMPRSIEVDIVSCCFHKSKKCWNCMYLPVSDYEVADEVLCVFR